ncbi:MAG: GNAT family N-acetyltransferase [Caldilineaceae bacterium]|nr:GNAT family N-acetyltransferase [Caldilineaceae bacterium]
MNTENKMTISIAAERPDSPDATLLIEELEAYLAPQYPQESRHGYSVDKLIQQGVAFFVARNDGEAAGCGGVQIFGQEYGELKRMYVRPRYRGLGLAKALLDHLTEYALRQGVSCLRLETGIHQTEAIGLYERWGFRRIGPFGAYRDDPLSLYFEKRL